MVASGKAAWPPVAQQMQGIAPAYLWDTPVYLWGYAIVVAGKLLECFSPLFPIVLLVLLHILSCVAKETYGYGKPQKSFKCIGKKESS